MFETITPASTLPVSLDELKLQLALTISQYDDLLSSLISTANELVEVEINGSVLDTEKYFYTGSFGSQVRIPHGRITTITDVEYRTIDGQWNELDSDVWTFDLIKGQAYIFPKYGQAFPSVTLYPANPIRITFQSGNLSISDIPASILHAIRLTAAYLFEHRDDAVLAMPKAAVSLVSNHKTVTQEMF